MPESLLAPGAVLALWTLVNVRMVVGSTSQYAAYIWSGTGAL